MAEQVSEERDGAEQSDPQIGVDKWVGEVEGRRQSNGGRLGPLRDRWDALPLVWKNVAFVAILLLIPLITLFQDVFTIRVATQWLAFAILAIGLTVVVGYAGLLDLGYNAFYGIAGYAFAYLSSDFVQISPFGINGLHVPPIISIPLIIIFTTLIGLLLGSTSLRLKGDYLAIVTLGFGLLFFQLAQTLTRVKLPWLPDAVDLTRGPNGINLIDDISFFDIFTFNDTIEYYYLFLIVLIIVYYAVLRLKSSRIGRALRSMREDELAAETMGMPTRYLKLFAFAFGAGIAATSGSLFAAWQGNVVPIRYSVILLINLYAMIVLGGLGSLTGAILGALIFTLLPEVLRDIQLATLLFYGGGLIGLYMWMNNRRRSAILMGATILGGIVLKVVVNVFFPGLDSGTAPAEGSLLNQVVQTWLVIPENFVVAGNIAIALGVVLLLGFSFIKTPWKWVALSVALYLSAFAWETRLATEASVTRLLILGLTLVVLMIKRPQGILGKRRVTIV